MTARICNDSVYPRVDSGDFWPEPEDCCTVNQVPVQAVWSVLVAACAIALLWQAPSIVAIAAEQRVRRRKLKALEVILVIEVCFVICSISLAILKATDATGDRGIGLNWTTSVLFGMAIFMCLIVNLVGMVEKVKLQMVLAFGDKSQSMGDDLYAANSCRIRTVLGVHFGLVLFVALCPVLMIVCPKYLPEFRTAFWTSSMVSVCVLSMQQLIALSRIASKIDLHWPAQKNTIKMDHLRESIISSQKWSLIGMVVGCIDLVFIFSPIFHYTTYGLWTSLFLFNLSTLQHSRRFLHKPQKSVILTKQKSALTMLQLGT